MSSFGEPPFTTCAPSSMSGSRYTLAARQSSNLISEEGISLREDDPCPTTITGVSNSRSGAIATIRQSFPDNQPAAPDSTQVPPSIDSVSPKHVATRNPVTLYFTLNERGEILAVNPAGAASLGYEAIALLHRPLVDLLHPQDVHHLKAQGCFRWANHPAAGVALPAPSDSQRQVLRFLKPNQEIYPVMVTWQPLQSSENSTLWLLEGHPQQEGDNPLETARQQLAESERIRAALAQQMVSFVRDIRRSLDLRQILHTTVHQVRRMLQADRVLICHSGATEQGAIMVEAIAPGSSSLLEQPLPPDWCNESIDHTYRDGKVRAFADLTQAGDDSQPSEARHHLDVRAKLVAPILKGEQVWGVLIAHQCHHPRSWQDWEVELMGQIAAQVEIAIQQSELYHQVQRLNADLERQIQIRTAQLQLAYNFEETLKRITDKVRDSLDEDQILQAAVQELATVIGVGACNAALYNLEEGTSTIRYEYTTTVSPSQGRVSQLSAFPEIYGQLFQGQYIQFCSVTPNPVRGHVAMLCVPIFDDKGVLGDLWLINQKYYAFSDQDIRLVQQVANQCAIALRQARLFQAAQAQVKELEKLNRLKDDFLSTVSHELRTPMSNIKMATQMLEIVLRQGGVLGDVSSRANRYFQILHDECQREIRLINDLLDLSRLDAGTEVFTPTTIDLATWIIPILQPFQERLANHQQQFEQQIPEHLPLVTDPGKLERVLVELLTNACKYTPAQERIILSIQVLPLSHEPASSRTAQPQGCLQIQLTNTGVEIAAEELPRIFEKFYRIPNNDPWQYGGTGLGLALVKKLVDHLGGSIQVASQQQQTSFILTLPLRCATASTSGRLNRA